MKRVRQGRRSGGFSLLEAIVISLILGVLIALLFPALMRSRVRRGTGISCVNNLKQIGLAFRQWSLDKSEYPYQQSVTNGGTKELVSSGITYIHFLVLSNELNTPRILVCPADTTRIAATNWTSFRNGNLSYFVGINASEASPQMFLSGDDHFTVNGVKPKRGLLELRTKSTVAWLPNRHGGQGNICLADGSVQGFSGLRFQQALTGTGGATNRLLMP